MLLRDEVEVALNDLIGMLDDARERYGRAAHSLVEKDLKALFRELERQRRHQSSELKEHVRRMGDLPHGLDPDLETARDLLARLKAALAPDERLALVEEGEATDSTIAARLTATLAMELPVPVRATLQRHQADLAAALGRLAEARARLGAHSR